MTFQMNGPWRRTNKSRTQSLEENTDKHFVKIVRRAHYSCSYQNYRPALVAYLLSEIVAGKDLCGFLFNPNSLVTGNSCQK